MRQDTLNDIQRNENIKKQEELLGKQSHDLAVKNMHAEGPPKHVNDARGNNIPIKQPGQMGRDSKRHF